MDRVDWFGPLAAGVLALLGLAPLQARARTLDGVTMPDDLTVQAQHLRLNGMGLRSFTFLHIHGYVAGLYVPVASHDPAALLAASGAKLVRIHYVHAAGLGRVQGEMRDGRARNCAQGCPPADDAAFKALFDTARAVRPGDITSYLFMPDRVEVSFNDDRLAVIRNADFSRRLLKGLIGANPPSLALRDGLLGG